MLITYRSTWMVTEMNGHVCEYSNDGVGRSLMLLIKQWLGLCLYCAFKIAHCALEQCSRILPIMLNLCSTCKVLAMLYEFNSLFLLSYLNYKIMNISSLSHSSIQSSTQLTFHLHMYINTLNSFLLHLQL